MQSDSLDILGALTCLIRTTKETNKLSSKSLFRTLQKISEDEGEPAYQCQAMKGFKNKIIKPIIPAIVQKLTHA